MCVIRYLGDLVPRVSLLLQEAGRKETLDTMKVPVRGTFSVNLLVEV